MQLGWTSLALLCLAVAIAWFWQDSLLPDAYSIMDMGYVDDGGAAHGTHGSHGETARSVTTLVADPDRHIDPVAALEDGYHRLPV